MRANLRSLVTSRHACNPEGSGVKVQRVDISASFPRKQHEGALCSFGRAALHPDAVTLCCNRNACKNPLEQSSMHADKSSGKGVSLDSRLSPPPAKVQIQKFAKSCFHHVVRWAEEKIQTICLCGGTNKYSSLIKSQFYRLIFFATFCCRLSSCSDLLLGNCPHTLLPYWMDS